MTLKPAMTRGVRVHNRSKFVSHCRFPTMRILSLIWLVFIPIILADQNLAAVQLPPVFIIADADSYGEPTSSTDGLFETRFNHIKTEWMPSIPSYLRVFVTEGTNNSGYDYVNSAINLDEINSVKNRTHINSTTEYSDRGLKLYEGSRFLLPALLHIQAGFNNNIDDIFTAFELPTCLPQGYQPTDTVLLLTTGIPTLPAVALAVVINRLYGERRNAQDMHIFGEHLLRPYPTPVGEATSLFASTTGIISLDIADASSFNAASLLDSDILPYCMHYCHLPIDASNNDGGGLCKMSSTAMSVMISPPLDCMCWINFNHYFEMPCSSFSISSVCAILFTPKQFCFTFDMIESTRFTVFTASLLTYDSTQSFLYSTLQRLRQNKRSILHVMVTSWGIYILPSINDLTRTMFYSYVQLGSAESSFITHNLLGWTLLDGHTHHLSYAFEHGVLMSFVLLMEQDVSLLMEQEVSMSFARDADKHESSIYSAHPVAFRDQGSCLHRRILTTAIDRSVFNLCCCWRLQMSYIIMQWIMGSTISSYSPSVELKLLHGDICVSQRWGGDTIHHYWNDLHATMSHFIFDGNFRSSTSCSPSRSVGRLIPFDYYFAYKNIQDIVSFEFWTSSTSIHRFNHVYLLWRGTFCESCTLCVPSDSVLLVEDIFLASLLELSMHKRTFNLCLGDNTTVLIIGKDARTTSTSLCIPPLVIGERSGIAQHRGMPSYLSSLAIIHLHDLFAITHVFYEDTHFQRIFLSWGTTSPNLLSVLSICVLPHDLSRCGTFVMDDSKTYAISTVVWRDEEMSYLDAYDHDTAWGAAANSPSNVFNTSAASTAMLCVSTTCTITLLQRLLRLSTRLSTCDCLYSEATLETGEHVSSVRIKRPSCTSLEYGERFICGPDKVIHVDCIQGAFATIADNNLLYGVCGKFTQQLVKRQICYDSTICASMQRLMDSVYRSSLEQYYRSVDMLVHYANLHASIASINAYLALGLFDITDNAAKAELQAFAIRRDITPDGHDIISFDASVCIESHTFRAMDYTTTSCPPNLSILTECSKSNTSGSTSRQLILTYVLELSRPDIPRELWRYYAGLGFFFGLILLLRRVMGSNAFRTVHLGTSISSRRGVTEMPNFCCMYGLSTDMYTYGYFLVSMESALTSTFRERNEGRSTMIVELIIGKYKQ